jgi:hypothetical protein
MRRILAILIAAAAVVGAIVLTVSMGDGTTVRGQEGTPTPPPQCLVPVDLDVVIIIDRTGSMVTNYSGSPPKTRLAWAQQAAIELVDGMAGGPLNPSLGTHHVEVMTFDGSAPVSLVIGFSGDADAVRAAINGITNPPTDVDTYIAPALYLATADLNAHVHGGERGSYKVVVLLSDGRNYANGDPTSGTTCPPTHARRADTVSAIPGLHAAADSVYTVSIGDETTCGVTHDMLCPPENCNPNELDHNLLVDIAEGPPGDYTNAADASSLPNIYGDISQEVVNICVNFSGHKYDDLSCNGPSGLVPLPGIDMVLLQGDTEKDRRTTDQTGAYIFVNELPGTYLICEDLPPDRIQTQPTAGSGIVSHPPYGLCYERTLTTAGGSEGDLDFANCVPPTPTPTPTPTFTPTPTKTFTPTPTRTHTPTPTKTNTPQPSPTPGHPGVGGIVKLPPAAVAAQSDASSPSSTSPLGTYAALMCGMAGALALAASGWYARRHWLR